MDGINIAEIVLWYVTFLFAVTLHEAAHAWAAYKFGDYTAYFGGQVSINPVPHMKREPFGMIFLPMISLFWNGWPFGFASTPYDPSWAAGNPRRAAWMALAGPAANFIIVLGSAGAIWAGILAGVFTNPDAVNVETVVVAASSGMWEAAAKLVSMFFSLNLILTVLNLFPLPPFDGLSVLTLVAGEDIGRRYRDFFSRSGLSWAGLMVVWFLFWPLYFPVFRVAIQVLYPWARYTFN